jgi:hypothetical protein
MWRHCCAAVSGDRRDDGQPHHDPPRRGPAVHPVRCTQHALPDLPDPAAASGLPSQRGAAPERPGHPRGATHHRPASNRWLELPPQLPLTARAQTSRWRMRVRSPPSAITGDLRASGYSWPRGPGTAGRGPPGQEQLIDAERDAVARAEFHRAGHRLVVRSSSLRPRPTRAAARRAAVEYIALGLTTNVIVTPTAGAESHLTATP